MHLLLLILFWSVIETDHQLGKLGLTQAIDKLADGGQLGLGRLALILLLADGRKHKVLVTRQKVFAPLEVFLCKKVVDVTGLLKRCNGLILAHMARLDHILNSLTLIGEASRN